MSSKFYSRHAECTFEIHASKNSNKNPKYFRSNCKKIRKHFFFEPIHFPQKVFPDTWNSVLTTMPKKFETKRRNVFAQKPEKNFKFSKIGKSSSGYVESSIDNTSEIFPHLWKKIGSKFYIFWKKKVFNKAVFSDLFSGHGKGFFEKLTSNFFSKGPKNFHS